MVLAAFSLFLLAFLLIGLASAFFSRGTKDDYYLASRDVSPALAGLSAVATNNSGYMFIGVIGFTYAAGLSSIWLMLGWIVGDFLASLVVHPRLRTFTEKTREVTFAGVLSRWRGTDFQVLRFVSALVSLAFLGAYAAAQLAAGGKALHAIFGWNEHTGAILVSMIVLFYCLAGGLRASIWTDAAQAFVMLAAMAMLLAVGATAVGGPEAAVDRLAHIPGFLDWFPHHLLLPGPPGMALFGLGWLFAGFSVVGQPHIMVRFMALDDPRQLGMTRLYYYGFFAAFYGAAMGVGLLSRLLLPHLGSLDPELALPTLAQDLLSPALVGVVLAGIFAATMSTADSLILSCSAAVTHDLLPRRIESTRGIKTATFATTLLALAIALSGSQSVFSLVILSWSVLASAFAPLLFVYAVGNSVSERQAIAMMACGVAAALGWRALGLQNMIYEGMPGILTGLVAYYGSRAYVNRFADSRKIPPAS